MADPTDQKPQKPQLKLIAGGGTDAGRTAPPPRPEVSEAIRQFRTRALATLAEHAPEDIRCGAMVMITEESEFVMLFGFTTLEQAVALLGGLECVRFKVASYLEECSK